MKNNRIRLAESQLHNVIKESVKQVLSELDWKTYASAAGKMYRQAREGFGKYPNNEIPFDSEHGRMYNRAEKFQKAANDALRKQHGEPNFKTNPKGSEEFLHYHNGEYEYKKGKGWQKKDGLDESIRKAIIKVLH